MEYVGRNYEARRLSERRQSQDTSQYTERRIAERREGFERRQVMEQHLKSLRSRLLAFFQPSPASTHSSKKTIWTDVPLWAPLGVFVLAFIAMMTNYGRMPEEITSFAPAPIDVSVPGDKPQNFEAGEVIVYDPSETDTSAFIRSGYEVIENLELKELGLTIQRLKIPSGMTVPKALQELQSRFPGLDIDANHQLTPANPS